MWLRILLAALVIMLTVAAGQRLHGGFLQLLGHSGGPVDLKLRHSDVATWFAGQPPYERGYSIYPPASLVILWPLLGWLDVPHAQYLWALTTALALGWLAVIFVKASGARTGLARIAVALSVPAVYATRAVIVNGQLILHQLPFLLSGLILLDRGRPGWRRDLGAAACLLVGLLKPTVAAPFVCLLLFAKKPLRPALLVGIGYVALTLMAALFQPTSIAKLVAKWMINASRDATRAATLAHANVHSWLLALGLERANALASLAVLGLFGWWAWRHRGADLWVRLGVAALVARFWAFHYRYDDVLILVPTIALCRLAVAAVPAGGDLAASVLLALAAATLLAPARLFFAPAPWPELVESVQTTVWLAALALLMLRAAQTSQSTWGAPGAPQAPL